MGSGYESFISKICDDVEKENPRNGIESAGSLFIWTAVPRAPLSQVDFDLMAIK
jgi:hypothetical protein